MTDAPDLESKVADWLGKQGYRLEYETFNEFCNAGLPATMGDYVTPSTGGAPREIDVSTIENQAHLILRVFCECKYSAENPWILLQSGNQGHLPTDWYGLPKSDNLAGFPTNLLDGFRTPLQECWHFNPSQQLAHSLVQAFRNNRPEKHDEFDKGRDVAFDSLRKIANAAWDYATTPMGNIAIVVIPCLVVEAPLMHAWYDADRRSFVVERTQLGRLSWSGCRDTFTAVDVVHRSALNEYAMKVRDTLVNLRELLTSWHLQNITPERPTFFKG